MWRAIHFCLGAVLSIAEEIDGRARSSPAPAPHPPRREPPSEERSIYSLTTLSDGELRLATRVVRDLDLETLFIR